PKAWKRQPNPRSGSRARRSGLSLPRAHCSRSSMSDGTPRLVGQLVSGRYRVLDTLGTGGMGQVYLAEHVAIQKRVALKVLHPEYSSKQDIVERFRQEAISASRIKHPNVLEIFDYG